MSDMSTYYMGALASIPSIVFTLVLSVLTIVAMWKIYEKAGENGWGAIIPFYNLYIMYKITWGSGWLFLLLLVPCVGFVFQIITCFKLAQAFGKGTGFGFGLLFLNTIFILILGFSDAEYVGVPGKEM